MSLKNFSSLFALLTLCGLALAPPPAAGQGLGPGDHELTIRFDGRNRDFIVHVPQGADGSVPVPLVLDFHGFTSNATQQRMVSGLLEKSEEETFIVVHAEGEGFFQSWNSGAICCGFALRRDLDDVGLAVAIVGEVSGLENVDASRVYASGLSNGGGLSHNIACMAADVFAAVAPVSMPLLVDPPDCQPSRPMPVMHFHGFGDTTVPYGGNMTFPPAQQSFATWAQKNGCTGDPVISFAVGGSFCETFNTCAEGATTTLCSLDGGHVLYSNNDNVDIADLAWSFFEAHTLP